MKKNKTFSIIVFISIIVIAISFYTFLIPNDLFYDIKIGDYIMKYGIDLKDHFANTSLSYTYPHWLFDVIIAIVFKLFSYTGIHIFTIICFILLLLLIYFVENKMNNKNYIISYLLLFLVASLLKMGITPRAQVLSYFIFILQIYVLETYLDTKNKKVLFLLPMLSFVLGQIHATIWPFQFILYLPYFAEALFYHFRKKKIKSNVFIPKFKIENLSCMKKVLPFILISFLIGLFTPKFAIGLTYFIKISSTTTTTYILEHQPTVLAKTIQYLLILIFMLFLFMFTKTKIRVRDFFMICGLIFMSLFSYRHILLFASIGLLFFGRYLSDFVNEESKSTIEILYSYFKKPIFVICFLIFLAIAGYSHYTYNKKNIKTLEDEYPVDAVEYIKENIDTTNMKLFNTYEDGSYLLFSDIKVFIDSRSDLYTSEFNKNISIFDDYIKVTENLDYKDVFKKYKFTHFLLKKNSPISKLLLNDSSYKVIYKDKNYILFES